MSRVILGFVFIILFNFGCKTKPDRAKHVTPLSPGMAHNLILQQLGNTAFQLIDVRTPQEFSQGHITGAINIDWMNDQKKLLTLAKKHTLLIYCQSGRRSQLAVNYLSDNGFHYLFHLQGGIIQWAKDIKSLTPSPKNEV